MLMQVTVKGNIHEKCKSVYFAYTAEYFCVVWQDVSTGSNGSLWKKTVFCGIMLDHWAMENTRKRPLMDLIDICRHTKGKVKTCWDIAHNYNAG